VFSSPTVIIIGAGSSVDYGLPLGKALWDQIVSDCDTLPNHLSEYIAKNIVASADVYFRDTSSDNPKAYAFFQLMRDAQGRVEYQQAKALAETVKRANVHDNVDDFVRDHPSLKKPMQALIAGNLFAHLYQKENGKSGWNLRPYLFASPLQGGPFPKAENWVRRFAGLCRDRLQPISGGVSPVKACVTVISFNYDRLMETVLREFWDKAETKYPRIDDCFMFLYPYGAFSELKRNVPDAGAWLVDQSERIAITEIVRSPQKALAREALENARQVFMLGFSCSDTNMEWLGLNAKPGKKVFAQNFRAHDKRLQRVLSDMNARSDISSMIELVRNGFFNQGH